MWARLRSLLRGVGKRNRIETEMADEMAFHLTARADDLVGRGLPREQALRQARLEFGALDNYKEECRESRGLRWVDELRGDVRYAVRQLRKTPSFTVLAVAILAIGIGANTAIFSAIDAVLLRMLPVREPEQLREIEWTARRTGFHNSYDGNSTQNAAGERVATSISYPVYQQLRDRTATFSDLLSFSGSSQRLNLTIRGHAQLARGQVVSGNFFRTLGAGALLGRTLEPEDDDFSGLSSVAVISHGFWERTFGADQGVLGQTIAVNGTPVVIVGVLHRGFCGVEPGWCRDVFLPMALQSVAYAGPDVLRDPRRWYFRVIGRLNPGVAEQQARAEMEILMRQAILALKPDREYDLPRIALLPAGRGLNGLRGELERPLMILGWAAGAILLIACANIGGLLLARASGRGREIGTRLALGAGRARLVRQLLTESIVLSSLGGAIGIGLAYLAGDTIARLFVGSERTLGVEIALNWRVLAVSAGLCALSGVVFGLAPALRATRVDLLPMLKSGRAADGRSRFRLGKALIAIQVALSLVLVAGSALFIRTVAALSSQTLGFRPENLLLFQLNPTLNGYRDGRVLNFHEEVLKRLEDVPGVRSASMSRWGLLAGSMSSDAVKLPGMKNVGVRIHYVAPRFFETMGVPLLLGRDISWSDREDSQLVLAINEALAKALFPEGGNPVGRTVLFGDRPTQIVALAGDTKFEDIRRPMSPTIYVPFRQSRQFSMTYVLRSETNPKALVSAARRAVETVDPNVPLYEIRTQTERINESMRRERLFAALLSSFAILALVLAALGIYGTLAYLVTKRTPEIGIRLALGAKRTNVQGLVLRESILPLLAGLAIGVWGALSAGKMIEAFLFGLKPQDPGTLTVAAGVLILSGVLAGWLPARRASRIEPMQALRHD